MNRTPAQAGYFYPNDPDVCNESLAECLAKAKAQTSTAALPEAIVAGIVPHAGWMFSGPTAARVYLAIQAQKTPETFIFFGTVHVHGVPRAALWKAGGWETPVGTVSVDAELAAKILEAGGDWIEDKPRAHNAEHSIEVQIPFICHLFPQAKIVPIMVAPFSDAYKVGECVAKVIGNKNVVAIGSTDMTHYGSNYSFTPAGLGATALSWVKQENDQRLIDIMLQLEAEKVVAETNARHNACGGGAIAATLGYARQLGKKSGQLLHYTTSHDVYPERRVDSFVGYAGVVF